MTETITLSPQAWDELQKIIDNPAPPSEALIKLAEQYRDDIASGRLISSVCVD